MAYGSTNYSSLIPMATEVNNTHREYSIFITIIVTGVIACLAVFARLGQKYVSRNWGPDDFAIIPALIIYIGWTGMAAFMTLHSGIGKPLGEVTYGEFVIFFKGSFIAIWMYPVLSATIRISILLFYRRLFAKASVVFNRIIWGLLVLQVLYVIPFEIIPAFVCKPVHKAWEPIQRLKFCKPKLYMDPTYSLYIISLIFDIILLVIPVFIVSKLQVTAKKRATVIFIFALMTCAPVAACYKLVIYKQKKTVDLSKTDPDWYKYQASAYIFPQFKTYGTDFWLPTHIEPTVALIGTSIPTLLKVFSAASLQFSKIRSAIASSIRGSGSSQGSQKSQRSKYSWRTGGSPATSSSENKFEQLNDSHVELRTATSKPSMRSDQMYTTTV